MIVPKSPPRLSLALLVLINFALAGKLSTPAHAQGFTVSSVAPGGVMRSPIVVRNVNTPTFHVAYSFFEASINTFRTRYATRTGPTGTWSVDAGLSTPGIVDGLVLGSSSPFNPHIVISSGAWYPSSSTWIGYATRSGSTWTAEPVLEKLASGDPYIQAMAGGIAMAPGDVPHVVYVTIPASPATHGSRLWVAHRTGPNAWARELVVETPGNVTIRDARIKITSGSVIHVLYRKETTQPYPQLPILSLEWCQFNGTWSAPEVVESSQVGSADLAITGNTFPAVAYSFGTQLRYAYRSGGWQKTDLGPCSPATNNSVSLVTGPGSFPLIAYSDDNSDSLRFASQSTLGWNFQRVAPSNLPVPVEGLSLTPSISYYTSSGSTRPQITFADNTPGGSGFVRLASGTATSTGTLAAQPATGDDWVQDGQLPTVSFASPATFSNDVSAIQVHLALANESDVTLELFDVNGRRASPARDETLPPGLHRVTLPVAGTLDRGVYFLRAATSAGSSVSQKLVLLR